ncbi:MAG: patatin-like phospholipase family protein [Chitinophagaceae bacterium]|nr:patatin-like phospholipase family protein [Oligoflexus sp.]
MTQLRTGLVLTGGGARVAYQVGAIKALQELLPNPSIPFQTLSGTSAGGINAAYLAAKADDWKAGADGLYNLWQKIELKDVYKTNSKSLSGIVFAWIFRTLLGGKSGTKEIANYLLNTAPLRDLLNSEIDFLAIRQNIHNNHLHALSITALQYFNDLTVSFFDAPHEIEDWMRAGRSGVRSSIKMEHVLASAAIPVFFPPVAIGDQFYGDGCIRQMTPLSPAIHLGADRLLCIGIRHERSLSETSMPIPKAPSIAQIAGELFNSLFLDPLHADAERLKRINESIGRVPAEQRRTGTGFLKQIPLLNLQPSRDLGELLSNLVKAFPPYLRYLLHGLGASDKDQQGQTLISYIAFVSECTHPLLMLGYDDTIARREEILNFMK